ncbi:unnamed protein product [Bursaphelenchus okinawaensis]|uniref:Uncharacterized protein n=1 Tax=Bursaphelenchus okinawaensis TaxID=465554 RepID=A0A811KEK7_9BILA|nr:unnamed protein product [Bursaphelenchus okinawaensis]CAG9101783.1 unnamed protein product [Bursaphelenchus okinawaensis]
MSSVPNSPQRGTQKPSKGRKTSTVTDRPSILSPTTIKTSPLATSLNIAAMSGSVIRAATTKEHGRTGKENGERGRKGSFRKSGKNRPPVPQNGAFINRRGSTSAALMSSSNSLWQTLVKTKHGPLAPMPGYDGMFMNLGPNGSKDNLFDDKKHKAKDKPPYDNIADDPKGSLIQRKKAALARRTNSLVELAVKAGKQPNERSDGNESTGSTHSSPLRPSLLRKDMRFCCSFRKPRRAKTASNLLDQHIQTNIPPFGVVNASAMSLINDPSVARQAISLLEAQMKPNPETVKMFTDEEKAVEEGMEVKRPHGLESITSPWKQEKKIGL